MPFFILSKINLPEKPLFDLVTPSGLTTLFEKVARGQIVQSIRHLDQLIDQMRPEDAWNQTSLELTQAAMAHIRYYVIGKGYPRVDVKLNTFCLI